MRQRVGFATRAGRSPNILLMDEPFSALDVLTPKRYAMIFSTCVRRQCHQGVLLVTHNIDEAVQMCDRLLISHHPGRVVSEIPISLPAAQCARSALYRSWTRCTPK